MTTENKILTLLGVVVAIIVTPGLFNALYNTLIITMIIAVKFFLFTPIGWIILILIAIYGNRGAKKVC